MTSNMNQICYPPIYSYYHKQQYRIKSVTLPLLFTVIIITTNIESNLLPSYYSYHHDQQYRHRAVRHDRQRRDCA